MGRPNVLDAPIVDALRNAGDAGLLATEIIAGTMGASARGVQFSLERLMASGAISRRFEWTSWPAGTPKEGLPRTRVYRYWVREFAPDDVESVVASPA